MDLQHIISDVEIEIGELELQDNSMLVTEDSSTEFLDEILTEPNPFLVEPILRALMLQMSFADLKNARLVSRLWDTLCVHQMEKLQSKKSKKGQNLVTIGENFEVEEFTQQVVHRGLFTKFYISFYSGYLSKILENPDLDILSNFQVTQLTLDFGNFKQVPGSLLSWTHIYNICTKVSKTLKKLQFSALEVGYDRGVYNFDPVEFPQLEKFWFEVKDLENGTPAQVYCQIVQIILQNSPKLHSIRMWEFPYFEETFADFCETRGFQKISRFGCEYIDHFYPLGCDSDYEDEDEDWLNYLGQLNFSEIKVKAFELNAGWPQRAFFKFVGSQAATLESLDIKFDVLNSYSEKKCEFPVLRNLKKCKFIFNDPGRMRDFEEYLSPFDFDEKFPNCVKFDVNKFRKFSNLIKNGSKSVKYLNVYDFYEETLVEKIDKLFPEVSLVKFLGNHDGESLFLFPKIYKRKIKNLKDLERMDLSTLKDIEILTIIISGDEIPIEKRQELLEILESITKKLQSLKKLTILFDGSMINSTFSDKDKELFGAIARDIRKECKHLNTVIISFR